MDQTTSEDQHDEQGHAGGPQDGHGSAGGLRSLRTYFLTGVVVAAPIGITLWLVTAFVTFVDNRVTPLIPAHYNPENYLPESLQDFGVPGLGVLVAVIMVTILGAFTTNLAGRSLVHYGERVVSRLPVVRSLYNGIKQIFETLITQGQGTFTRVGIIQYPRPNLWAVVFIATTTKGEIRERTGTDMVSVFLPTIPNPTTGFLIFVPKKDIIILDMSVEEAAKLVLSAGLVVPPRNGPPDVAPVSLSEFIHSQATEGGSEQVPALAEAPSNPSANT